MFAVVTIAGKQHAVAVGDTLDVEKLAGNVGDTVTFDRVFLMSDDKKTKIGTPTVKGVKVVAKIVAQEKGKKIDIHRFKSKVRFRRSYGFRPHETKLAITSIG